MKTLSLIAVLAAFVLTGCGHKQLSKEEAAVLIRKGYGYPHVYDYDIFCGDSRHANVVLEKGLEARGFVTVHRTLKWKEIGRVPIIEFTRKATPYFLPTSKEDRASKIQKVKIGNEDLYQVTSITTDGGSKTATVTYTTKCTGLTPFSVLLKRDMDKPFKHTAIIIWSDDDGWVLQKKK